jgi:hypothetical protein
VLVFIVASNSSTATIKLKAQVKHQSSAMQHAREF